jgi:hypothetical protein
MKILMMRTSMLRPYEKNAKTHPAEQVSRIARSIEEFGWQQPLVVDKDNVVVIGHGRLMAAKKLGLEKVPVVKADNLTDEQIRALRLADNKTAESSWDDGLLRLSLDEITDIDMTDFGFNLDFDDDMDNGDDDIDFRDPSCQHNVFENQERMQFPTESFYGMPIMAPTQTTGDQMLRFMDWKEVSDPENYIAHFYYDDYKFISAWREPDKYLERLKKFKAVVSPDFSLYTDFPRALQILSCYRRQWCGAFWQSQGIDVIPDVVWGDEKSFEYCFDGIPKGGTVAVSTVGVANDKQWNDKESDMFRAGYNEMLKRLEPTTILFYGTMIEGCEGNIIRIPSYYEQKFSGKDK